MVSDDNRGGVTTEIHSTTNTGRLATLALPNSEIRLRGEKDKPAVLGDLVTQDRTALFLFPSEEARVLTPALRDSLVGPFTLIVPDGNWRQASKVNRREPALKQAIPVKLPPGPPSRYGLRKAPRAECLSTMEAIAQAFGVLEGEGVRVALENLFLAMVSRTLWSRSPDAVAAYLARL